MQTTELGRFITQVMPRLTRDERAVALEIYKGLAADGTISVAALGERTGLDAARVDAILSPWPGVYRDEQHGITGFWGLTARPISKHMLRINGQTRYAWCAWDCLFLSTLLGQPMQVSSICAQTGEPIELVVSPNSVEHVRPDSTVLSMLMTDEESFRQDVVSTFCHFVYFFKDEEAALKWTASRLATGVITLDQGLALGRVKNQWQFGDLP